MRTLIVDDEAHLKTIVGRPYSYRSASTGRMRVARQAG